MDLINERVISQDTRAQILADKMGLKVLRSAVYGTDISTGC